MRVHRAIVFMLVWGWINAAYGASPLPSPLPQLAEPPTIRALLKPKIYERVTQDREVQSYASLDSVDGLGARSPGSVGGPTPPLLDDKRYSFYSVMLVHADLRRTRRVLTDYSLYSKLVPYVDKTTYSAATHTLDIEGGVWKWRLRSWVRFDEKSERWIHFTIVAGHFQGLEGDLLFEGMGEKGTLVYFRGEQRGSRWPPKFVIERGAEIVFGFTAGRMRKYVENSEDHAHDSPANEASETPEPRLHL